MTLPPELEQHLICQAHGKICRFQLASCRKILLPRVVASWLEERKREFETRINAYMSPKNRVRKISVTEYKVLEIFVAVFGGKTK